MMRTDRKFADFGRGLPYYCMDTIPEGGMCLSVFLLLSKGADGSVLLGKVNPEYEYWSHIGALDQSRLERFSKAWMIPSRHLILGESPEQAASTVLREQLGLDNVQLTDPKVITEVYDIERAGLKNHWDIEFLFFGKVTGDAKPHSAWSELRFVDVSSLPDSEFARGHQDILANAGLRKLKQNSRNP
jgi:ADP-ribose pyrophosphatase YjhB (NUDIX family)